MYVVPRWMAFYAAAAVLLAFAVLLYNSPAVGVIGLLTLFAVLLVALGATPHRLQSRIGRISVAPDEAAEIHATQTTMPIVAPAAARDDPEALVRVPPVAVHRTLARHGFAFYSTRALPVPEVRALATRYWKGTDGHPPTFESRQAAAALDALCDRLTAGHPKQQEKP